MKIKNKNWDARERRLDDVPELQSFHKGRLRDVSDEASGAELIRILRRIQYLTDRIKQRAESFSRYSDMAIPDNIISFRSNGFDIDVDNMPVEQKYSFRFESSRYIIWKNADDELVVKETG